MYIDQSLIFSSAQAITATAVSTNIVDLTGFGSGNAPAISFGTASVYGADAGVGDGEAVPSIYCNVNTTFATLTSLTVSAQFAVDNGSNAPGTYQTYAETGAIPVAALVAGARIGTFRLPNKPDTLAQYPLPRFIRLNYTVTGSNATAGAVSAGIAIQRDLELAGANYPGAFTVAA